MSKVNSHRLPGLTEWIERVGDLPRWMLEQSGAICAADLWTEAIHENLSNEINRFRAIRDWVLSDYLDQELPQEFEPGYMPFGILSTARMRLCVPLLRRLPEAQEMFKCAGLMWFVMEASDLMASWRLTGMGQALHIRELSSSPVLIGKTEYLKIHSGSITRKEPAGAIGGQVLKWVENNAAKVALNDKSFAPQYEAYIKTQIEFRKALKTNSQIQISYLLNGKAHVTAKGKRAKPRGFGTQ